MKLAELIKGLQVIDTHGPLDIEVIDISYDSRLVKEGDLFVAIPGTRDDGHRFLQDACQRGARCAIVQAIPEDPPALTLIQVADARHALAMTAAELFRHPSRDVTLVGITGTSGKTTTSYLLESIIKFAGHEPGVIGTINYRMKGEQHPAPTTTPQSYDLQRLLRRMVDIGVNHVVIEVSSHALDQQRVRGCHFDAAIFTNISPEHLDYHVDMGCYLGAKRRLFTEVLPESVKGGWAIINRDDPLVNPLCQELSPNSTITYGITQGDVRAARAEYSINGIRGKISTPAGELEVESRLIGTYNLSNILAATAAAIVLDIPLEAIAEGIRGLRLVPGRMERIGNAGPLVLVDYAHKPEALQKSLSELRRLITGKLIVVFGCGGDRDKGKRRPMGRIGATLADLAIITTDNPRTEDPMEIIAEIEAGAREVSTGSYLVIPDRREAIAKAIYLAGNGDCILITGKGHEDYQIIGEERLPFDDRKEALEALTRRYKG